MFISRVLLFCILILIPGIITAEQTGYSITKHISNPGDAIGETSWTDTILTNGGNMAMNKNFDFDSQNQTVSSYNLQSEKVLTYASTEGAHLLGEESYVLHTAGSYGSDEQIIRCIFADQDQRWIPAFCNTVQVKVSLINVNQAQISQRGTLRMVGGTDIPAALNYQVAVSPDTRFGSSPADGTVKTSFVGSVMEARDRSTNESGTSNWRDSTEITSAITSFQKNYAYQSGLF